MQPRAGRQRQEFEARSADVLAEIAGLHVEALGAQFVEQLGMDQMHLAQIRLRRILAYPRAMLDRLAHMGVAGDTETGQQPDAQARRLPELITAPPANRDG